MEGEWIKARSTKTNADVAAFFEELKKSVAKHDPQTVYVSSFPAPGN